MISSADIDRPVLPALPAGAPAFRLPIGLTTLFLALAVLAVVTVSFSATLSLIEFGVTREEVPLVIEQLSKLTKFLLKFDTGGEQTVAAWLSSMLLLLCALVLLYLATIKRHLGQAYAMHWLGLAVIFVVLSMDEAVGFHEMTIMPMREMLGASGIFLFAWVVPALGCVALVGIAYLSFLGHLEPAFRLRFVIAGALFVGGAVGFEMMEGALVSFYGHHRVLYEIAIHLEDSLEFAGELVFLHSLLLYVRQGDPQMVLQLT